MEGYGVSETAENDRGGAVARRLVRGLQSPNDRGDAGDVVVLFGGKGSGKSTFLRRALLHNPPQYIKKHSLPVFIDLLHAPKEQQALRTKIWDGLVSALDSGKLLSGSRDELLRLFEDRWEIASRQDLYGFAPDQPVYNETLNALVAHWKRETTYVARRLIEWHERHHRGVIIVLDNTDQLENELQDFTFSVAQELMQEFKCIVLISMREERFYGSKIRGMLDAYHSSAFHISSPSSVEVLERRLAYVITLLSQPTGDEQGERRNRELISFLRIFQSDLRREPTSPLNRIVSASAHGNVRMALDLFHELIISGYTNAREMLDVSDVWTIQVHQVLRPLMTPMRLFYSESQSRMPNLLQIRVAEGGSHFTGLRILRHLSDGQDHTNPSYVPFAQLRSFFAARFGNDEDFCAWIDKLLATNLIEASTRQDFFSDAIDSLRITSFGEYCLVELHKVFTYIDLVATDCGLRTESASNELTRLSNEEVQLLHENRRFERVERRLRKARAFLEYLLEEERREMSMFGISQGECFAETMLRSFEVEEVSVLRSARRNA